MHWARLRASPTGNSIPRSGWRSSRTPGISVAMVGRPAAILSRMALGRPSDSLENTNISLQARWPSTLSGSTPPTNSTRFAIPRSMAVCSSTLSFWSFSHDAQHGRGCRASVGECLEYRRNSLTTNEARHGHQPQWHVKLRPPPEHLDRHAVGNKLISFARLGNRCRRPLTCSH
jgi:hypothetical protein